MTAAYYISSRNIGTSLFDKTARLAALFFSYAILIVVVGFILAMIWAIKPNDQRRHAKSFITGVIVTSVCYFGSYVFLIPIGRMDCGHYCVDATFSYYSDIWILVASLIFWLLVSWIEYRFMLKYSKG